MTPEEFDALPISIGIPVACDVLDISTSSGYALAKAGKFPCRVIRVGSRYVVPTAGLRELLGMGETAGAA
ncbi:hypothetical protein CH304_12785 [Rhodococcus sp. 15-649-1-2]|nr:hypothetical protein CH304_12785 [Rhodococcus sp. 15-649-1-2]